MSSKQSSSSCSIPEELLLEFFSEADDVLDCYNQSINKVVLLADQTETKSFVLDDELFKELKSSIHNLKSLAQLVGFQEVEQLAAPIIDQLDQTAASEYRFDDSLTSMLQESQFALQQIFNEAKSGDTISSIEATIEEIENHMNQVESNPTDSSATSNPSDNLVTQLEPEFAKNIRQVFAETENTDGIPEKYLAIYIDETDTTLDELSDILLAAEDREKSNANTQLLISSHRIKGSAAAVGLNRPAKLAHYMEDILQELSDKKLELTSDLIDVYLECLDNLRTDLKYLKEGKAFNDQFAELAIRLITAAEPVLNSQSEADSPKIANNADIQPSESCNTCKSHYAEAEQALANYFGMRDAHDLIVEVHLQDKFPLPGLKAQLLHEKASHLGQVVYVHPAEEQFDSIEESKTLILGLTSDHPGEKFEQILNLAGVESIQVTEVDVSIEPPAELNNLESQKIEPDVKSQEAKTVLETESKQSETTGSSTSAGTKVVDKEVTSKPSETLRVDIDRLDQLMNLAGQLVINKARFSQLGEGLRNAIPSKQARHTVQYALNQVQKISSAAENTNDSVELRLRELDFIRSQIGSLESSLLTIQADYQRLTKMHNNIGELSEAVHQLERISDGIQKSIMDTRMVPIGPLFNRFRRVIRDISKKNEKSIQLIITGEKTELDKRMIDELSDPLIHMIRNSADHGIESPEQRVSSGKPEQGKIELDAFHRGNNIVIQVTDDGRGVDSQKILAKAIEKGLLTEKDAEALTEKQILNLIWEPGFSTAEQVTEISGRGMGMDIVRSKIEEINGFIELESVPGQGTVFTIKLPLTMAILPSLMAEIDKEIYSIPIDSVIEIIKIPKEDFSTVNQKRTASVRKRIVSILTFDELLGSKIGAEADEVLPKEEATVVIIGQEGLEIGILVDNLLGEEDVVVKSLAENYQNVPGIAGASILGNGSVSLILDPISLIHIASTHKIN